MPTAVNCSLGGSTVSSDYAYFGGVNMVTVEVTDSKQATASGIVTVTVAVPVVASPIYGINFSPYENGQTPQPGGALSVDEITQRMGVIAPYVKWVRVYRSSGGEENSGAIAHKFGLKACLGAGIGSDTSPNGINEIQMTNLIAHAQNGEADCAVIGTEALFRGDITPAQLISYIDRFRAAVPTVPVATADIYLSLLTNPDVVNDCDFVFANYYPYWEGQDLSIAVSYLNSEDELLRHTYPGKEIIVSETGWPSGGDTVGNGVPSLTNAAIYFLNFESWAQARQRKSFYFEVFDEAWKATPDAPQQSLFGVFDANGVIKYGNDVFSGTTVPDNWTCTTIPGGTATAAIQFTSVPPIGSKSLLTGQVSHVNPASYYVVVYIHVPGLGWWVKPFATAPLTFVNCDGTWNANIVTGGSDASADQIAAFLIPRTYNPPILQGAGTLSADLLNNAVTTVSVNRP
jgi:exo-beta-1,3-glucanase (GH17 family)